MTFDHRRPGFDEFLQRLKSRGLRYRLQRMSNVLPAELLEEMRRNTSVNVVGGPVTGRAASTAGVGTDVRGCRGEHSDCGNDDDDDNDGGGGGVNVVAGVVPATVGTGNNGAGAAGFDEFVLCSVFRASDEGRSITSR